MNSVDLLKGKKNYGKLVKKVITDKNGKKQTVWHDPNKGQLKQKSKKLKDIDIELWNKIKRKPKGKGGEVQLTEKETKTLLKYGKVGFISAGVNPADERESNLSEAEVVKRYKNLQSDLKAKGLTFVKAHGKYGEEEDSFMVMANDIEREELSELGTKYNQDSIVYSDADNNEMIFTSGDHKGMKYKGNGFKELSSDAADFYTDIEVPTGSFKFALNFNFESLTKSYIDRILKADTIEQVDDIINEIQKGGKKDKAKLQKKTVIDKNGQKRTVWVKLGEAVKSRVKAVKEELGKRKKKHEDKYDTNKAANLFTRKMQGIVQAVKHEAHEWKDAGRGLKKLVTKSGKITPHEKHAIKTVAIHAGIVVALALYGGGAGGAVLLGKKIALGFLEHAGILRIGHALIFAKAEEGESDEEDDEDISEAEAQHYMERMLISMSNYVRSQGAEGNEKEEKNDEDKSKGSHEESKG